MKPHRSNAKRGITLRLASPVSGKTDKPRAFLNFRAMVVRAAHGVNRREKLDRA
jgi:hypothetical protein